MDNNIRFFGKPKDTLEQIKQAQQVLDEAMEGLQKQIDRQEARAKATGQEQWEHVQGTYDDETKTLYMDAYEHQYLPAFLKYLLEFLKLPADTKIEFKK